MWKYGLLVGTLTALGWLVLMMLAALIMSGCGSSYLLDEGNYNVVGSVSITTDPFSENFQSEWKVIHKNDGKYNLVLNSITEMHGADSDGVARFALTQTDGNENCKMFSNLLAILEPIDEGFTGTVFASYTFCSYYDPETEETILVDWNTEYSVFGELK